MNVDTDEDGGALNDATNLLNVEDIVLDMMDDEVDSESVQRDSGAKL